MRRRGGSKAVAGGVKKGVRGAVATWAGREGKNVVGQGNNASAEW